MGEDVDLLLDDTKSELEEAHWQHAHGCRMRANMQWAEEGEAYFSNLERKHGENQTFTAIKTLGGVVVSSLTLIVRAWVAFYALLFTAQPLDIKQQDFFLSQLRQWLTDEERSCCEGELTLDECKAALDGMALGKSPGIDGLPAEFYQRFWPLFWSDLVEVINTSYHTGCLSSSDHSIVQTRGSSRNEELAPYNFALC